MRAGLFGSSHISAVRSVELSTSSRNAGLRRGRDDDARVVRPREAGASRRELLVVALLLDIQEHREQAHDAHARDKAWRREALFERVDGLGAGVDAETAVWVRHCVGEVTLNVGSRRRSGARVYVG